MTITDAQRESWGPPLPHTYKYAEVPLDGLKGRVIRCVGYNHNTLSVYGWCWAPEFSRARKPQFMHQLRLSIQAEGLRNPVVVYALEEGDFLSFGGSRALAAQDLELESIPAVVNDYCGRYDEAADVNIENWSSFFTDVPQHFEFTDYGIETHYALERNRRHEYDHAGIQWTEHKCVDSSFIVEEFSWINGYSQR